MTIHSTSKAKALAWRKDYYYDHSEAMRVIKFFENELTLTDSCEGERFVLMPYQRKILRDVFGWKSRADHKRKIRTLFLFVAKKNAKSILGAGIALYLLHADRENAPQVCSAAADKDQAKVLFTMAKKMNQAAPNLRHRSVAFGEQITCYKNGGHYKVLSAEAYTKHGPNWHGIIFDELHTQPDSELFETLTAGTVARSQPLTVIMTTAGHDETSMAYDQYDYAKKVRDGIIIDPSYYPVIYESDGSIDKDTGLEKDPWDSEETWKKANPGWGITVNAKYFHQKVIECRNDPTKLAAFRRLHCNQWTKQLEAAIDMAQWHACAGNVNPEDLRGQDCWLGVDLASTRDLGALALVFKRPKGYAALLKYFCPSEMLKERKKGAGSSFDIWVKKGYIRETEGSRIDYDVIENEILKCGDEYNIQQVAIDPWNAQQLSTRLEKTHGLTVVSVRQGMFSLSAATKEFLDSIAEKQFEHFGNPVLTWNASNLAIVEDAAGNKMPSKELSKRKKKNEKITGTKQTLKKIDGITAIVNALTRVLVAPETHSTYESQDVRSF